MVGILGFDSYYILGKKSFGTLGKFEGDSFTLTKRPKSLHSYFRVMDKYVLSKFIDNEPVAFAVVKPFYLAGVANPCCFNSLVHSFPLSCLYLLLLSIYKFIIFYTNMDLKSIYKFEKYKKLDLVCFRIYSYRSNILLFFQEVILVQVWSY